MICRVVTYLYKISEIDREFLEFEKICEIYHKFKYEAPGCPLFPRILELSPCYKGLNGLILLMLHFQLQRVLILL
jgi:hypothetical protein